MTDPKLGSPALAEGVRDKKLRQMRVCCNGCLNEFMVTLPALAEAAVPQCVDCGAALNEGEAKTFTVCDACWDTHYPKQRAAPCTCPAPAFADQEHDGDCPRGLAEAAVPSETLEALRAENQRLRDGLVDMRTRAEAAEELVTQLQRVGVLVCLKCKTALWF